ncbi:hypothetical protein EX30DRAFT_338529 [Ascodesmis nigricans]|uniref:Uncharacterized protein n=1 Tax=Ascodesmis nigricans TaxID=341454 RepID=A0A4S2N472_9PEZI|nr:hypothetical protein EX30DRAFT_338529 [Ascodesmis nigricans]
MAAPLTTEERSELARVQAPKEFKHRYYFEAVMSCGGCSGAIDRVLKKLGEKEKTETNDFYHEVSLEHQSAHVFADETELEKVFEVIEKTKKKLTKAKEVDAQGNVVREIKLEDGKRV